MDLKENKLKLEGNNLKALPFELWLSSHAFRIREHIVKDVRCETRNCEHAMHANRKSKKTSDKTPTSAALSCCYSFSYFRHLLSSALLLLVWLLV
jgi:hypothetical protein